MESPPKRLSDFVTADRLANVKRLISKANLFQITALSIQTLILYYLFFSADLPSWLFIFETVFLAIGVASLSLSLSYDPSDRQLWISFTMTKVTLLVGAATIFVALLFAGNALDYVFFLPGPFLTLFAFFARRVVEREVMLRKRRGANPGEYGNLEGIIVGLSPYGYDPSTQFRWKEVFSWLLFLELLTIASIFRANSPSSNHLPIDSPNFWTYFLEAVSITAVIGLVVGIVIAETRKRWNMGVTGPIKLDTLDKSRLWFYSSNGGFNCFKLFDRPMVTVTDDQGIVVAHWLPSFVVRTNSPEDFQTLLSVLQNETNYGPDGRKVSSKP